MRKKTSYIKLLDLKFPARVRLAMASQLVDISSHSTKRVAVANINLLPKEYFNNMDDETLNNEIAKVIKGKLALVTNLSLISRDIPGNVREDAALAIALLETRQDKQYLIDKVNNINYTDDHIHNKSLLLNFLASELSTYK